MEKITVYFKCLGVTSDEEEIILKEDSDSVWIEDANPSGNPYKFDKQTGKCLNDNAMFGGSRFIKPICK